MRCSRCHRSMLTATVAIGGMVFGPECSKIMGLIPTHQQAAKTQHRAIKRVVKGAFLKHTLVVQDRQVELFEGLTA